MSVTNQAEISAGEEWARRLLRKPAASPAAERQLTQAERIAAWLAQNERERQAEQQIAPAPAHRADVRLRPSTGPRPTDIPDSFRHARITVQRRDGSVWHGKA